MEYPSLYRESPSSLGVADALYPEFEMSEIESSSSAEPVELPSASFEFLVFSIRAQAEMQLGLFHFGKEGKPQQPDLSMARHTIDMLGVLQEKTKGNLSLEEQRLLENSLTELRFRFVQASGK